MQTQQVHKTERAPMVLDVADLEWFVGHGWLKQFYGSGAPFAALRVQTERCDEQRADRARIVDFTRAAEIHRRLELLREGEGRMHAAVLWWFYIERSGASRIKSDVETRLNIYGQLGAAFADEEQRENWRKARKSVREAGVTNFGRRLHDAAKAAFHRAGAQ